MNHHPENIYSNGICRPAIEKEEVGGVVPMGWTPAQKLLKEQLVKEDPFMDSVIPKIIEKVTKAA